MKKASMMSACWTFKQIDQIEHGMKFDTPDQTYGLLEASIKNKMQ